jgi:hypothetical protein
MPAIVTRHYLDHPTIKIAAGSTTSRKPRFRPRRQRRGILERLPLAALKETLQIAAQRKQLKSPLRLQFIGDRSETVLGDERFFRNFGWAPLRVLDSKLVNTFGEWQQAVLESAGKTDFLITRITAGDALGHDGPEPAGELIAWTESHARTVHRATVFTRRWRHAGLGALRTGRAAKLTAQILDHGTPRSRYASHHQPVRRYARNRHPSGISICRKSEARHAPANISNRRKPMKLPTRLGIALLMSAIPAMTPTTRRAWKNQHIVVIYWKIVFRPFQALFPA